MQNLAISRAVNFEKMIPNITATEANITTGQATQKPTKAFKLDPLNMTISFLAVILNVIELAFICRIKRIKSFERILCSLCCADIFVTVFYLVQEFYGYQTKTPLLGALDYHLGFTIISFSVTSSIANIIILGVDRTIAVKYPLRRVMWMTNSRIYGLITTAWMGAIGLSVIANVNRYVTPKTNTTAVGYTSVIIYTSIIFVSSVVITILYAVIAHTVMRRRKKMKESRASARHNQNGEDMAVVITCVLVVLAYLICSLPYAVDKLLNDRATVIPIKTILLNALLDPIIYFFKGYIQRRMKNKMENTASFTETSFGLRGLDSSQASIVQA